MKIYQINVVCGKGSTGRIAVDLSKCIESHGGSCRIAYGRGKAPTNVNTVKISNNFDLYWHVIMTRLFDKHGLCSKASTQKLIRDIKSYSPDIIHLHNIHGYYVNYEELFRFLKEYHRPVVWTMHDCWAFTGHCAHFDSVDCMQWQDECMVCQNYSAYPATRHGGNVRKNFYRKKEAFSDLSKLTIVTPSAWLKAQVEHSFLKDIETLHISNGIDLNLFKPYENEVKSNLGCTDKKLVLGVASVWTKNKGFDDFISLRKVLDNNYTICMIGLTKQQIGELPDGMIGIERTDSIFELAQYYSAADVFVNMTYEDTFPTTNIEALACGTPVITYLTGGSPEIISDECGMAVEKGNLSKVADCIYKLTACDRKNVSACVKRAALYDKTSCFENYIDLYYTIMSNVRK